MASMGPVTVKPGLSFAEVAASANDKTRKPSQGDAISIASAGPQTVASTSLGRLNHGDRLPVSEENINQLTMANESAKPSGPDVPPCLTSAAPSVATFPLDEKESLRPDDSASVKDAEDGDMRVLNRSSSNLGSNSEVRAFHDQLNEIAAVEPASHATPSMHRVSPAILSQKPYANMPYANVPFLDARSYPSIPPVSVPPIDARSIAATSVEPDERLIEALEGKDRLWLLKLEQDIVNFVQAPGAPFYDVEHCANSFYRMLAHRLADYYLLAHTIGDISSDDPQSVVRLLKTPDSRLPISLTNYGYQPPATDTAALAPMKILRRDDTRSNSQDGTAAADGDSGSDASKNKLVASREERTARYEAARLRIMGSAKPSETDLTTKDLDESRSSSAAGRRKSSKRTGNDDGFEARSAYNSFSSSATTPVEGVPTFAQFYPMSDNRVLPFGLPTGPYNTGPTNNAFYPPMMKADPEYHTQIPPFDGWPDMSHPSHTPFELANQFNQSMTLQSPPMGTAGYPHTMHPNIFGHPGTQAWAPDMPDASQRLPAGQSIHQAGMYGVYPYGVPAAQYMNHDYAYAANFGPPHFNAQSQVFAPGQGNFSSSSYQIQGGSPVEQMNGGMRTGAPQRQRSTRHNKPLSDRRLYNGDEGIQRNGSRSARASSQSSPSDSIHKWATPASLPAKPPPPAAGTPSAKSFQSAATQSPRPWSGSVPLCASPIQQNQSGTNASQPPRTIPGGPGHATGQDDRL